MNKKLLSLALAGSIGLSTTAPVQAFTLNTAAAGAKIIGKETVAFGLLKIGQKALYHSANGLFSTGIKLTERNRSKATNLLLNAAINVAYGRPFYASSYDLSNCLATSAVGAAITVIAGHYFLRLQKSVMKDIQTYNE